jgi:hypothetical protein
VIGLRATVPSHASHISMRKVIAEKCSTINRFNNIALMPGR